MGKSKFCVSIICVLFGFVCILIIMVGCLVGVDKVDDGIEEECKVIVCVLIVDDD